jgi:putative addiction module CopG family antidote
MVLHVPGDIEAQIREKVESGEYRDTTDVIRVALRLLEARDRRLHEIRTSLAEAKASIDRGEGSELTPELMERIDREADQRLRLGLAPKPDVCP